MIRTGVMAFEALAQLEKAISDHGGAPRFDFEYNPSTHSGEFMVRSRETGSHLLVARELLSDGRDLVRFHLQYLLFDKPTPAGFEIDITGCGLTEKGKDMDQFCERYLAPGCAALANMICENAYQDSKSLLMA